MKSGRIDDFSATEDWRADEYGLIVIAWQTEKRRQAAALQDRTARLRRRALQRREQC